MNTFINLIVPYLHWTISLVLILIGFFTVIRPFMEWTFNQVSSWKAALGCACELLVGLILLFAGFHILHW